MSRLRELVQSYLKGSDSDVLVTDQSATFTRAEFYKKVFQYVDLFNQSWASVPSSSKSVAILLERNADYLAAKAFIHESTHEPTHDYLNKIQ